MTKPFLAALLLVGLAATASNRADAAPAVTAIQLDQAHPGFTQVDYYWHRQHYHHRRWSHGHWRYYN